MSHTPNLTIGLEITDPSYVPYGITSSEQTGSPSDVKLVSVFEKPSVSAHIESQIPSFIRYDHPKFIEFLKKYYDWLDIKGNTNYDLKRIKEYGDIDSAKEEFEEYLHKQFLINMPRTIAANKPQVLKHIRDFYRSKGTEKSFKFFFRALYNSPAEFYYPRKDILKLSDGKYVRQKSIRVSLVSGTPKNLKNSRIIGTKTKTQAYVDHCREIKTENETYYELFLNVSSVTGKFSPREIVECKNDTDIVSFSGVVLPVISKAVPTIDSNTTKPNVGIGYQVGDCFLVENAEGKKGIIKVSSVNADGSIKRLSVKEFGFNYSKSSFVVDLNSTVAAPNVKYSLSSKGNTFNLRLEQYAAVLTISNFVTEDSILEATTRFSENSIINIVSQYGSKRYIITKNIDDFQNELQLFLVPFDDAPRPEFFETTLLAVESIVGVGAKVEVSPDVFCDYPGYYISNDGQLSETKYLQDGEFYQQFSYVVYNKESLQTYISYLKDMVHPIGLKFYGGFRDPIKTTAPRNTPSTSPVKRTFQQYPRYVLFPHISVPDVRLVKNGILQIENTDYTLIPTGMFSEDNNPLYSIRLFGNAATVEDDFEIIYKNNTGNIITKHIELSSQPNTLQLPSSISERRYEDQLVAPLLNLKAPIIESKNKQIQKSPALDGIKNAHQTRVLKTTTKSELAFGPKRSCISRDRFHFKPNETLSEGLQQFVDGLNQVEQQRLSRPSVYPDYEPKVFSYTPDPDTTISDWSDSFDDNGIETQYNTYHQDSEKTSVLNNAQYWGDLDSPGNQYANTQIRHFKHIIPKSLETDDVPEFLIIKNGTLLIDNEDYLIVGKNKNPYNMIDRYSIKLLGNAPLSNDVFEIVYKDMQTRKIITKTLQHTTEHKYITIPHSVSAIRANMRINIMPDSVVTRGILIED